MNEKETLRRKLLDLGLSMARSGEHTDHRSIFAELRCRTDYWVAQYELECPGVHKQFDIVCAETQRRGSRSRLTGMPTPAEEQVADRMLPV